MEFIHLDRENKSGGLVINLAQINAFYYRESDNRTLIFVGGGTKEHEFVVNGNHTEEICEIISMLGCAYCGKAKNDEQKADE